MFQHDHGCWVGGGANANFLTRAWAEGSASTPLSKCLKAIITCTHRAPSTRKGVICHHHNRGDFSHASAHRGLPPGAGQITKPARSPELHRQITYERHLAVGDYGPCAFWLSQSHRILRTLADRALIL